MSGGRKDRCSEAEKGEESREEGRQQWVEERCWGEEEEKMESKGHWNNAGKMEK